MIFLLILFPILTGSINKKLYYSLTEGEWYLSCLKGILMQIWKSASISVFIWKQYVEDFTLKHLYFLRYVHVRYVKVCLQTFRNISTC